MNNEKPFTFADADIVGAMIDLSEAQREHEKYPQPMSKETSDAIEAAYDKGDIAEFNRLHDSNALENFKRNLERMVLWPQQKAVLDVLRS